MRLTKIVCTLGPASRDASRILTLAKEGMNVARINCAHGTEEEHRATIRMVRNANELHNLAIGVMIDIKGPEIRTGDVKLPVSILKGQEVLFASSGASVEEGKLPVIRVNYDGFCKDAPSAERIILDNGSLTLDFVSVRPDGSVLARAREDGSVGSRRHVNLPGAEISLPALTDKDWKNLSIGMEEGADFVAVSFIRQAADVEEVKAFLRKHKSPMRVIAKIETRQAVQHIDGIIAAADGIMVARGDLGVELPFERIPAVQDMIVQKCREAGTPVIVATHMLESMIENPMPTRAEVTDIAHAAVTRADATMLSGETASGKYPVESLRTMSRILEETELHLAPESAEHARCPFGERHALAHAAASMALSLQTPAVAVITRSGKTAELMSTLRPRIPIIAMAESPSVQRMLQLSFGVIPLLLRFDSDPETTLNHALATIAQQKLLPQGTSLVVVSDVKTRNGNVRTVHLRQVP